MQKQKPTYDHSGYRVSMCMHDMDFISVQEAFLQVVRDMDEKPTREQLQLLWDELSYGLYLVVQGYRLWPEAGDVEKHRKNDSTRAWLLRMKFYFNEEADLHVNERSEGEAHMLDTRLPYEAQIYRY